MDTVNDRYELIPGDRIIASLTNPRRDFSSPAAVAALEDLKASILEKGIVEPMIVRPASGKKHADKLEIVCGERRFRAGQMAALLTFPCIVRHYTDEQVLEVQLIENVQRSDLAPLERARGFAALIQKNPDKHSAESLGRRLGKSANWVWDQLTLLRLIPEAQRLLEERVDFTIGHAVPLARLTPAQQKRALDPKDGGLWTDENAILPELEGRKKGPYDGLKIRSIREFTGWIARHVRLDLEQAAAVAPFDFGEAAARVEEAKAAAPPKQRARVVVPITLDHVCPPEAKDAKEKTLGAGAWRRAEKPCEYRVLGTVVAGEEAYGQTFEVCTEREKCRVHWGTEIRARQKSEKLRRAGKTSAANKRDRQEAERQAQKRAREEAAAATWERLRPQLNSAIRKAVSEIGDKLTPRAFAYLLKHYNLPKHTKPAGLARALLENLVASMTTNFGYYGNQEARWRFAETVGVDIKALRAADAKKQKESESKAKTKATAA